jgi:hypothetical protein
VKRKPSRKEKRRSAKAILRLPDLEAAKSAVLNSLSCPDAQRGYRHAIDEFMERRRTSAKSMAIEICGRWPRSWAVNL